MKILKFILLLFFVFLITTGCTVDKEDTNDIIYVSFLDYDDTVVGQRVVEKLEEIEMPDVSRIGYTLKEWVITNQTTTSISYKAVYDANKYSLKFTTDGIIIPNLEVTYNETISLPIPEKPKYIFLYWTYEGKVLDENFVYEYDKDIRIVAQYRHEDSFLVEYVDPDGTLYKEMYVVNLIEASCENPNKIGHTFLKWIKTEDTDKVTFTAEYKANVYDLVFASNSKITYEIYTFTYGMTIDGLPTPTKDNYTFMGWYYNNEKIEVPYVMKIPNNVTLYAKWEKTNFSNVSHQEFLDFVNKADKWVNEANQFQITSDVDYSISTYVKGYGTVSSSTSSKFNYKIDNQNSYFEKKIDEFRNSGYEIHRKIDNDMYLDTLTDYNGTYYLETKLLTKANDYGYKVLLFTSNFRENESFRKIADNHYLAYTTLKTLVFDEFDLRELADELKVNVNDLAEVGIELEISFINNEIIYKTYLQDFTFAFEDRVFKLSLNISHKFDSYNVSIDQFDYSKHNIVSKAATKISDIVETTDLSKNILGFTSPNPHYYRVYLEKGLYSLDYSTFQTSDITILDKNLVTYKFNDLWNYDQIPNVFYIDKSGTYYLKIQRSDITRYNFKITKRDYQTIADINNPLPLNVNNTAEFEGDFDFVYYSYNFEKNTTLYIDTKGMYFNVYAMGPSKNIYFAIPTIDDYNKYFVEVEKGYTLLILVSDKAQTVKFSISFE